MVYGNWMGHTAVVASATPSVVAKCPITQQYTEAQDVKFVAYDDVDTLMKMAEPTLQAIYDSSWKLRKAIVYKKSKNLTKSVMRVPAGFNGGGFSLAASVNDAPVSQSNETIEDLLEAGVKMQFYGEEDVAALCDELINDLSAPSYAATKKHGQTLATALSYMQANQMAYRVDGTPVVLPSGVEMQNAESWRFEASKRRADDCDGSAANIVATIQQAVRTEQLEKDKFPYMRAVANSIGAHYVYGVSILGANAGHADNADQNATKVTGHAVAALIPKPSVLIALDIGAQHPYADQAAASESTRTSVSNARFDALYPRNLVNQMPPNERLNFSGIDAMVALTQSEGASKTLQPLFPEGTTPSSSRAYTHEQKDRSYRAQVFETDKEIGTSFAPNMLRMAKLLDSASKNDSVDHAFYSEFVELLISPTSGLMTDPKLRELESATCHLLLCQPPASGPIKFAGASPKEIALGDFAMVPLWRVGKQLGAIVDVAHQEAVSNAIPRRRMPDLVLPSEKTQLERSHEALGALSGKIATERSLTELQQDEKLHSMLYMASFDSMLRNPSAIEHFSKIIANHPNKVVGKVVKHQVRGVATQPADSDTKLLAEAGVFAQISLWVERG
jgi:hypothetical protein